MTARAGCALMLLAFAATPALAAAPAADGADVQDVLFLGPLRPVVLRLRISLDGKPFRQAWLARLNELFDAEDRDHDGRLTAQQAAAVLHEMHGSLSEPPADDLAPHLTDGTIDREGLLAHATRLLPNLVLKRRAAIGQGSALALFPLLDTDRNQQLSAAELAAAEVQLRERDFNDDGAISAAELILDPKAIAAAADPEAADRGLKGDEGAIVLLGPGTTANQVGRRLLVHFDHNRDGVLAAETPGAEISLPPATLAQLDRNGDRRLDVAELEAFAALSPDVELPLSYGQVSAADRRKRVPRPADSISVRQRLQSGYEIDLGDAHIKLARDNRDPRQTDFVEMRTYDRDGNSYIDLAEAQSGGIGKTIFAAMDADSDGKVFKGELSSFVGRQNEAAATRFTLIVTEIGQDLRKMLDVDDDGLLSARELRLAANVLAVADKNGDGLLAGDEIPQELIIELVRGLDERSDPLRIRSNGPTTAQASTAGPLWFRKFDRNNDGDVSPQEFIGPLATFRKLDTNGDGLIDREEAEAAKPQ